MHCLYIITAIHVTYRSQRSKERKAGYSIITQQHEITFQLTPNDSENCLLKESLVESVSCILERSHKKMLQSLSRN